MRKPLLVGVSAISLAIGLTVSAQAQINNPCPNGRCPETEHEEHCGDQLGHLRRVYAEEIIAIDDGYRVWITEICPEFSLMRSDGNAVGLRDVIARNPILVDALQSRSFTANDVFAVRMMGDDTINLFVHHFNDYR